MVSEPRNVINAASKIMLHMSKIFMCNEHELVVSSRLLKGSARILMPICNNAQCVASFASVGSECNGIDLVLVCVFYLSDRGFNDPGRIDDVVQLGSNYAQTSAGI